MVETIYYPLNTIQNFQEILCVENHFTENEIHNLVKDLSSRSLSKGFVGEMVPEEADKKRKSNISFLDAGYESLYEKIIVAIKHVNSINYNKFLYGIEPLQYTEYDSGYEGFYGIHVDVTPDTQFGFRRSLSFSIQLSEPDSYSGGELKIYYKDKVAIANKKLGDITFFDSSYPHEVTPVTSGVRKSLVGWVLGPRV